MVWLNLRWQCDQFFLNSYWNHVRIICIKKYAGIGMYQTLMLLLRPQQTFQNYVEIRVTILVCYFQIMPSCIHRHTMQLMWGVCTIYFDEILFQFYFQLTFSYRNKGWINIYLYRHRYPEFLVGDIINYIIISIIFSKAINFTRFHTPTVILVSAQFIFGNIMTRRT